MTTSRNSVFLGSVVPVLCNRTVKSDAVSVRVDELRKGKCEMKAFYVMFVVFAVLLLGAPIASAQDGWPGCPEGLPTT